ncbi:methyltransferase [Cupriavidus pauculus]|uniref:Methyltransferase n=2 Tax=Cupriavidus pauculus TaxID=82633 RepID=A0A2N5C6T6_9BURK|nr:methyltransferase [Cupriavidus pauculus]
MTLPLLRLRKESNTATHPKIAPRLSGVSETMLWTLYDRAYEARCPDSVLCDPDSVRICDVLDYDFAGRFGIPTGVFSARAATIDRLVRCWLHRHPEGLVVSLGEGLETQARRVDNGRMRWLTVELAPAIALRRQLIPACHRFRQLASSVVEPSWTDEIEPGATVYVIAQGLFMYLKAEAVRRIVLQIVECIPGVEIVFDIIPRWFSRLTLWGVMQTPRYRLPPMPWGIDSDEIETQLRAWTPRIASVHVLEYRAPRGWPRVAEEAFRLYPRAKEHLPAIVHVKAL